MSTGRFWAGSDSLIFEPFSSSRLFCCNSYPLLMHWKQSIRSQCPRAAECCGMEWLHESATSAEEAREQEENRDLFWAVAEVLRQQQCYLHTQICPSQLIIHRTQTGLSAVITINLLVTLSCGRIFIYFLFCCRWLIFFLLMENFLNNPAIIHHSFNILHNTFPLQNSVINGALFIYRLTF